MEKLKQKQVKFKELKVKECFYLPDYVKGFEIKYIKLSNDIFADVITKECYYMDNQESTVAIYNEQKGEKNEI